MPNFLSEIRLDGIRGVNGLKIGLDYPVCVVAGGNASGKSTVLFAAACAYKVPGAGPRKHVPSALFPDYRPRQNGRSDERPEINLDYEYATPDGRRSMRWRRRKGWSRSFFGRQGARQPERTVYLRTLSNLSNPSEVRGILRMSHLKTVPKEELLTASQINFAQQILPFHYHEVAKLSSGDKSMLFAAHKDGAAYSELHMAAGERAVLRISHEIAQLEDALVLIDEVEAGLHPWIQKLLMLQLQQLALRNSLQIIVTTHSPVVIDTVPHHARVFLERDEHGKVNVLPPYRDLVQDALYGRSSEAVNLLCEDEAAEGILNGVLDVLALDQKIQRGLFRIGRNTGAQEFPTHAKAFRKFGMIHNFVFILDGDQRGKVEKKIREAAGDDRIPILSLPGGHAPEAWVWNCLQAKPAVWAERLNRDAHAFNAELARLNAVYDSASDSPSEIAKYKLEGLAEGQHEDVPSLCRTVARWEAEEEDSGIQPLAEELKDFFLQWREKGM